MTRSCSEKYERDSLVRPALGKTVRSAVRGMIQTASRFWESFFNMHRRAGGENGVPDLLVPSDMNPGCKVHAAPSGAPRTHVDVIFDPFVEVDSVNVEAIPFSQRLQKVQREWCGYSIGLNQPWTHKDTLNGRETPSGLEEPNLVPHGCWNRP